MSTFDNGSGPAELATIAFNLRAAKMFSLASCVMLFYDIGITVVDEVERIWMQPKYTLVTFLYAVNRYITPMGYVVIIVSFHQPWPIDVCDRYILFPEAFKLVTSAAIGVIFVLRVHAIYYRDLRVTSSAGAVLFIQLAVKIWAFTDGTRLILPDGLVGCILVGKTHSRIAFTWIAELIFDTMILALTLWRTILLYRRQRASPLSLYKLVIRDGVVYFGVIFAANLANVLVFMLAPPDLKAINASFSTLITSLMVSRLILNLKSALLKANGTETSSRAAVLNVDAHNLSFHDDIEADLDKTGLRPSSRWQGLEVSGNEVDYELSPIAKR
ncbi:hypothetical protein FA15DRAFT_82543 [Coprinopsis marcescibilis]|uniref:DUF6533 domain-containing protein n=1 Tax=Coprinopsis marcescibilis TaxID=230819 RepID=A0A5C3KZK6_COPMA|nr:hypothetical protein FA15DRAFT_82543 [Coprinopsis marcescibilis]